jgi:DNA-binding beta-propeller fold protein YncE
MRKAAILLFLLPATLVAQSGSAPNPYRLAEWGQLPAGAKWGGVISIQPDRNGNIWVFHRSDPGILKFDASGKVVTSFGAGMFAQAHGMDVDRDGNVWVTDAQTMGNKGQQVFKFSPDGKLLLTLGKAGVAAEGPDTFNGPADVVVAPNGDIFVADGHAQMATGRIVKFSKDGKFVKAWGRNGNGPGEFNVPHSIAMDSRGRLFVADRANNRIQIFDQDGKFLDQWKQFGRPSGVYIDRNDMVYVADSQSNKTTNPGFARGIYIGSAKDGKVTAFIPYTDGSVYVGDVTGMKLRKFVRAK